MIFTKCLQGPECISLTSLPGRAQPDTQTPASGQAHPALSFSSRVTLSCPLSSLNPMLRAFGAHSLGHTSWRCPPSPSPKVPPWPPPSPYAPQRGHSQPLWLTWQPRQGPLPSRHPWEAPPGLGAGTWQLHHRQRQVRNPRGARAEHNPASRATTHRSHPPSSINKPV